ncbi:HNH endonuclease [Streptomyces sp. NPDC057193]|uniref:HNH endonuclease n=1 Tax=Streptomyces sp. NPDC057193 TaxID=3346043 RepID=UPI0036414534
MIVPLEDCMWCGGAITDDKAPNAIFCSKLCKDEVRSASRHRLSRPDYLDLIKNRRCLECEAPIPESSSIRARFCPGRTCLQRFNIRRWSEANPDRVNEHSRISAQRRRARLAEVTVEGFSHQEIFQRDEWLCQLCGGEVSPKAKWPELMSASLDHIIPLARQGDHTRINVQLAHLLCNLRKSDKLLDDSV